MRITNTLVAVALVAVTAACGNTADGVKEDANAAAERGQEAAAATGEKVSGALQTTEIKTAIIADTRVGAGDINVDTDETLKTVTLSGSVKTDAERVLAGEIATSKAQGYTVVNNLTVKP